jgi:hypothetical protein
LAGCCECGDEPSGSGATELVSENSSTGHAKGKHAETEWYSHKPTLLFLKKGKQAELQHYALNIGQRTSRKSSS